MTESAIEQAGMEALNRARQGPVDFSLLQQLAHAHAIPLQRLLSFMDVVSGGGCRIDYEARQADCRDWKGT